MTETNRDDLKTTVREWLLTDVRRYKKMADVPEDMAEHVLTSIQAGSEMERSKKGLASMDFSDGTLPQKHAATALARRVNKIKKALKHFDEEGGNVTKIFPAFADFLGDLSSADYLRDILYDSKPHSFVASNGHILAALPYDDSIVLPTAEKLGKNGFRYRLNNEKQGPDRFGDGYGDYERAMCIPRGVTVWAGHLEINEDLLRQAIYAKYLNDAIRSCGGRSKLGMLVNLCPTPSDDYYEILGKREKIQRGATAKLSEALNFFKVRLNPRYWLAAVTFHYAIGTKEVVVISSGNDSVLLADKADQRKATCLMGMRYGRGTGDNTLKPHINVRYKAAQYGGNNPKHQPEFNLPSRARRCTPLSPMYVKQTRASYFAFVEKKQESQTNSPPSGETS